MLVALQDMRRLLGAYFTRLQAWVATAPPGSLQLTGVLGLAALVFAAYHMRRPAGGSGGRADSRSGSGPARALAAAGRASPQQQQQQQGSGRLAGGAGGGSSGAAAGKAGAGSGRQPGRAAATPLGRAVRAKLHGIGKVTISAVGALTEEQQSTQLQDGVTLRPAALEVLREVAACADTYLITQVQDEVGQAVMLGALEAAGVLGGRPGQVRPHHVLFCCTLDGKVSLVRQLEPDLHIDNAAKTVEDLKRFMPRLLHIPPPGHDAAGQGASNVASSPSLAAHFGP